LNPSLVHRADDFAKSSEVSHSVPYELILLWRDYGTLELGSGQLPSASTSTSSQKLTSLLPSSGNRKRHAVTNAQANGPKKLLSQNNKLWFSLWIHLADAASANCGKEYCGLKDWWKIPSTILASLGYVEIDVKKNENEHLQNAVVPQNWKQVEDRWMFPVYVFGFVEEGVAVLCRVCGSTFEVKQRTGESEGKGFKGEGMKAPLVDHLKLHKVYRETPILYSLKDDNEQELLYKSINTFTKFFCYINKKRKRLGREYKLEPVVDFAFDKDGSAHPVKCEKILPAPKSTSQTDVIQHLKLCLSGKGINYHKPLSIFVSQDEKMGLNLDNPLML